MVPPLECSNLSKSFGGLEAVRNVTLRVMEGERKAIVGPNGAGKTTLFRLISGEFSPTSGNVRLFGRDVTGLKAYERTRLGLGRTFQITNLFPTLNVIDNLLLAQLGLEKSKFSMAKPLSSYKKFYQKAIALLERIGMFDKRDEIVKYLSHGDQRQIEIGMALVIDPRVLLLDEPTAGLSPAESKLITQMIKNLDPKISILVIEHDMDVAFEISNSITVLNFGAIFAEGTQEQIRKHKGVQEIYLGVE